MVFNQDFFKEEVREGFVIPEMMKRAWAATYEVLEVIDNVCNRLGLQYYAYAGTLLGAVRHQGFIPWDDDLDICMLKDDYLKFIELAPQELPEGFVISGMYAGEKRLQEANQEPQVRVIADEKYFPLPKYMNRFHSFPYMRIGVDIFPLYYLPNDLEKQIELIETINEMQVIARYFEEYKKRGELDNRIRKIEKKLGYKFDNYDDEFLIQNLRICSDKIAASVDASDAELVSNTPYGKPIKDKNNFGGYIGYNPKWFGKGTKLKFENTEIIVPEKYHEVLEAEFGKDYMTPKMFTSDHSYPFYKSQEEAFKNLLVESGITTSVEDFCRNWHMMNGGT